MSIRAMPDRRIVTHSLFCGLGVLGLALAAATSPAAAEMPATSGDVAYATAAGAAPARLATSGDDPRIVVSIEKRHLWLIDGRDTLMSVPAAVGMGKEVDLLGHSFYFATPEGVRRVLAKKGDPLWIVPDWHYYEVAEDEGLEIVWMKPGERYDLSDGSYLEMRGDSVGRVNTFGNFWAVQPGLEIIYDGKLFVPPKTSPQRHIPDALGPYKLVLGDGYLIHGVNDYDEESVGKAVSHGCIRLSNEDLEKLYHLVPVGTRVVIR